VRACARARERERRERRDRERKRDIRDEKREGRREDEMMI
jgi:hypothetical protein